ncbi:DNA helicase [Tanacetum coccineum]
MRDNIPAKISKMTGIPNYHVNTAELQGYILYELEEMLNGFGKFITDFRMQLPSKHLLKDLENKLLMEEKNYNRDLLKEDVAQSVPKLNHDQKKIYDLIISASVSNQQELLFVYSHGVTAPGLRFRLTTWSSQLIDFIYDDKNLKTPTAGALQEKAIVFPKNKTADVVNAKILSDIEGQSRTYLSNDMAIPMGKETSKTELLYPMEYLNTITFLGFPPHELELKVGSSIMLLRNVNMSGGLCNRTRMIVKSLMSKQSRKMSTTTIASLRIGQENCILEAKVYRKWISKSVPDMKELAFCCILIDREYNFKATVTDTTATAQLMFYTNVDDKITGHPCSELTQKYKETGDRKLPLEIVNTISKKHIFQIHFAPSIRKGAGEFIVDDILDIQPAAKTPNIGAMLATSSATTTKESTSKDKNIPGAILTTSPATVVNESSNKDKEIPGIHYDSDNKAPTFITSNIIHAANTNT